MSGHTPGPWVSLGSRGDVKSVCKGFAETMVAKAAGRETTAERAANARLIAAAPDLLEALVEMLATHPAAYRDAGAIDNRTDNAVKLARAALTKAKEQT